MQNVEENTTASHSTDRAAEEAALRILVERVMMDLPDDTADEEAIRTALEETLRANAARMVAIGKAKVPRTPEELSRAVEAAVREGGEAPDELAHGLVAYGAEDRTQRIRRIARAARIRIEAERREHMIAEELLAAVEAGDESAIHRLLSERVFTVARTTGALRLAIELAEAVVVPELGAMDYGDVARAAMRQERLIGRAGEQLARAMLAAFAGRTVDELGMGKD